MNLHDFIEKYRYAIFLIGVLFVVLAIGNIFSTGYAVANVPSEERCQGMGTIMDDYHMRYAKSYWCEYNETGWHFNRTKFKESFRSTT